MSNSGDQRHLGLLMELLDDPRREVANAAAMALGRIGRVEVRPLLMGLLRREPSAEVIEALAPIADAEVIVTFGRVARATPDLAQPVLDALDQLGDFHADRIAAAQRAAARLDSQASALWLAKNPGYSDGRAPNDPPEIALKLVPFIVSRKLRDAVEGDLAEEFRKCAARRGQPYALGVLWWDIAGLCICRFTPTAIITAIGAWFRQKLGW